MYILTEKGKRKITHYIEELLAKRKEILDARKDTADNTPIPTVSDVECDINFCVDGNDDYLNIWGATDHYDADEALNLTYWIDFVEHE